MAKIAYFGIPAHGHTNPSLPLVQELVQRGHEVLYYNVEAFRAKIAPTGVDFRPYPEPVPTEREISEAIGEFIQASLIFSKLAEHLTPFALSEVAREQPALILHDSLAMWGYIAARTYHVPQVCSLTHFVLDGSVGAIGYKTMIRFFWASLRHIPTLLRWKQRMAKRYGKDITGGLTEYGDLNLVFTSRAFHPRNTFVDERFRFVGPSINPATRGDDLTFTKPDDQPMVYISLGTINHLDTAFYQAAFAAFADFPAHFVLSVGKNTDISQLGTIPANFTVYPYVPQLAVLQQAAVFITHGGMNSVHEGLYYGVPLIVVPHQFEQYLNGKRVKETGAGILLGGEYPFGRVTADELRQSLGEILTNPAYRQHAWEIGLTLKDAGGYRRAADEIEGFLAEAIKNPSQSGRVLLHNLDSNQEPIG